MFGLKNRLLRFIRELISNKQDLSIDQLKSTWLNAEKHYCGDHSHCLKQHNRAYIWTNRNDNDSKMNLRNFLNKGLSVIENCTKARNTQRNESFHNQKIKYACKRISWRDSWEARVGATVLQHNWPYQWIFEIRRRLKLPNLSLDVMTRFLSYVRRENKHREYKASPQQLQKHAKSRAIARN